MATDCFTHSCPACDHGSEQEAIARVLADLRRQVERLRPPDEDPRTWLRGYIAAVNDFLALIDTAQSQHGVK